MEPTIYKPSIYKGTGIYNGAGGIYKGRGVYKNGEGGGIPPLPPEYTALKYIECGLNTGTPQIAGVANIAFDDTISLSCEFLENINGISWLYFFYTWSFNLRSFKLEGYNQRAFHRWNSTTSDEQATNFTKGLFELVCSKDVCEINGVQYPTNTGSPDSSQNLGRIFHFGFNQSCRAYAFKVVDNGGNLKNNLIPAKRNEDGILGFYDVVQNNFRNSVDNQGWTIPGPEL